MTRDPNTPSELDRQHDSSRPPGILGAALSRRTLMTGIAGGVGLSLLSGLRPAVAATPSPSPILPGEYSRKANQVTMYKGTLFDNVVVKIKGDPARIYIPQTIKPGQSTPIRVVWLYHGAGSDHNALDQGFQKTGHRIVDEGMIAICQRAAGETMYSHPLAQTAQINGYPYLADLYPILGNYLRATSGGGALACETLGSKLIPDILGMYNVNAVYDLEAMYAQGGDAKATVITAFGDDLAAIHASNPARLPASSWRGTTMRIIVSQPNDTDQTVPPDQHGLALLALAGPVAKEASLRTHSLGHTTPPFANDDFVISMARWAPSAPPPADTRAPVATVVAPSAGATVSGTVTLSATATDDTGVTGVSFSLGSTPLGAATLSGGVWSRTLDTTTAATPNGNYSVTATATDAAGNAGVSAPVSFTVQNSDTVAPTVTITSPAEGAVVSGTITVTAVATDNVAVTGVKFYSAGRLFGSGTLANGVWSMVFNTKNRLTPNGVYSITAQATDAAGNVGTSPAVTVRITN